MEVGQSLQELGCGISSFETSTLISELIGKNTGNGGNGNRLQHVTNEPRLGMAMKARFKPQTSLGRGIWGDRKELFVSDVIKTYWLLTEIAERVQAGTDTTRGGTGSSIN